MSPRAAWRLEALGFEHVADYVGGKADWLGHGLPREGETAAPPSAGELADRDPPTCGLNTTAADIATLLASSRYGFCLVLNEQRVVLGRVRRSAIADADPRSPAESVMEPGRSTVRPNTSAAELAERLAARNLKTAIVTTPGGGLVGVVHRVDAERALARNEAT